MLASEAMFAHEDLPLELQVRSEKPKNLDARKYAMDKSQMLGILRQ